MGIDETWNDDFPRNVDFPATLVAFASSNDGIAAYGDVGGNKFSSYEVEESSALENYICRFTARTLIDARFKFRIHAAFLRLLVYVVRENFQYLHS
jgi:hypothetical protein